jgi:hypothetical protein
MKDLCKNRFFIRQNDNLIALSFIENNFFCLETKETKVQDLNPSTASRSG